MVSSHLCLLSVLSFTPGNFRLDPILHVLAGEQVAHPLHTETLGAGGVIWEVDEATVMAPCLCHHFLQEKRRAERAEQQRIRAEKEKERQARLAVSVFVSVSALHWKRFDAEICISEKK